MSAKKTKAELKSFEEGLEQLEETVKKLESGDLSLEDSLAAFEQGISLVRALSEKLGEVEKRVEMLVEGEEGKLALRKWEPGEE